MNNTNGTAPAVMLPILPHISFEDEECSQLRFRLDLHDDTIVATKYDQKGQQLSTFVVDPLDLASHLGNLDINTGLLPENVLFWQRRGSEERLGVWVPPQIWSLRVEPTDKVNRVIPLPGFVFVGQGKNYGLWALDGTERPTAETELYHAPTPNVFPGGVCAGNVEFPTITASTIWQAVSAFFESGFNSHLDNNKSQKYPLGILRMWRVLHRAKAKAYPADDLVPTNRTLEWVINAT